MVSRKGAEAQRKKKMGCRESYGLEFGPKSGTRVETTGLLPKSKVLPLRNKAGVACSSQLRDKGTVDIPIPTTWMQPFGPLRSRVTQQYARIKPDTERATSLHYEEIHRKKIGPTVRRLKWKTL